MRLKEREMPNRSHKHPEKITLSAIPKVGKNKSTLTWGSFFSWGMTILTLSVLIGGLFSVKNQLSSTYQEAFSSFKWMVLVEGDQLRHDEIGRDLKQIANVGDVHYVSSSDAADRMARVGLFEEELMNFEEAFFPASWEVSWRPSNGVNVGYFEDVLQDVSRIPGVVDVVFDVQKWDVVQKARNQWLQIRVLLSLIILLVLFSGIIFLGSAFFFSSLKKLGTKTVFGIGLTGIVWWSIGILLISRFFSPISPWFFVGGLVAGSTLVLWKMKV